MNKTLKLLSFILCLCLIACCVSCTGDKPNEQQKTSQKVYNTVFQTATTAVPNSTTALETETTNDANANAQNNPATVKRDTERPVFEQINDMRKISSKQLLSQLGNGITLGTSFTSRGLAEGSDIYAYETASKIPAVKFELINAYKREGFDIVRIPVCWSDHIDENGVVEVKWLDRIQQIVDYCITSDLYCIINSQNDQNWLTTNNKNFAQTKAKFTQMWTDIANRFADYDDRLIFEGIADVLKAENDKSAPSKTDYLNANKLNQAFVDAVRKTGKNNAKRHLVVSTYGAFVDSTSLAAFSVPKDSAKNKIIAKVNLFVPSSFCLDESTNNIWGSESDKQYLESVFAGINQRFSELKVPVIVGEFGAVDKGNMSARAAYAKHFVSTAYNYYMVCFWNDDAKDMAVVNRANYELSSPAIVNSMRTAIN